MTVDKPRLNVAAVVKELTDEEIKVLMEALLEESMRRGQAALQNLKHPRPE